MSVPRICRAALFSAFTLAALPGCSSDSGTRGTSNQTSIADVLLEGKATEDELRVVLGNEADDWAWAGGAFDTPEDGQALPAAAPFEFSWRSDPVISEPGKNEASYLLVFSSPGNGKLLRVFTTLSTYTPSAGDWDKLVQAGAAITLNITGATFADGVLVEEGGPHAGQTLTFTVE